MTWGRIAAPLLSYSLIVRLMKCGSWYDLSTNRSEEHTSELQSHRDLHSFPTRRSSDLIKSEHDMGPYRSAIAELQFNRALDEVWVMVRSLNQYLESLKPWEIAKKREKDPEAESHLAEVLGHAVSTLLQI